MRIVFNEIKKIFGLRTIIMLLIISVIVYFLLISFYLKNFPNGRPEKDYNKICAQMIKDYGTSMDDKEFENFKDIYSKQVKEADKFLQSRPEFVKAGITTYEKFKDDVWKSSDTSKLAEKVIFEENRDIFWELQTREGIISDYERKESRSNRPGLSEGLIQRFNEMSKSGSNRSILPWFVLENYDSIILYVTIIIVLGLLFAISPIYIRDKNNKVNYIQYTTKTGRKIFKSKLIAALISSFIIMTVYLAAAFTLYSHNKTGIYMNSSLDSFINRFEFWYNMTFRQYIVLTVAGIYIIGFALTLIGAFVSRIAPNYITIVGIQILIFFVIIKLCSEILLTRFAAAIHPKFLQPTVYIILVLAGVISIALRIKKEKAVDIVC